MQTTDDFSTRAAKASTPEEVAKLTQEFFARKPSEPSQAPSADQAAAEEAETPGEGETKEEGAGETAATEAEETAKETESEEKSEKPAEGEEEEADEETEASEAEAEEAKAKRWRLKLSAEDKVGELAIKIKKRNEDLTLEESIARAREQLGIKAPKEEKGEKESGEPPAPEKPATLEETNAKIAKLREERHKAQSEDLDFQKAAQLEKEIEALMDHKFELREKQREQREQEAKKQAEEESKARREYDAKFNESKKQAETLYEFTRKPESPEAKRAMEIDAELEKTKDPLFFSPDKPLVIAQMVAKEFRIAPKAPNAKQAAKPVEKKSVVASGASRTVTNNTQTGQQLERINQIKSPQELEKFLREHGVNAL